MIINKAELYIFHNTDNRDCVDTKHRKLWIIKEYKFRMFDFQSKVSQKKAFCSHCRIVGDVNTLVRALFPATAHCAGRAYSPSILEGVPEGRGSNIGILIPFFHNPHAHNYPQCSFR